MILMLNNEMTCENYLVTTAAKLVEQKGYGFMETST